MNPNFSPERWEQVQRLFNELVDLDPAVRLEHLFQVRKDDPEVFAEVNTLLAAYDHADDVLRSVEPAVHKPSRPADFGHYRLLEELGSGGMGVVYRAYNEKMERTVAIKFLPFHLSADEEARRRFMVEARAASALDHPNVCTIHNVDETPDGRLFIEMALCGGRTVRDLIADGPLTVETSLRIALQTAEALAAAHEKGVIHRDIKPSNLIVSRSGTVKVVDFGLAKREDLEITRTGTMLGTVAYMSPEQARGDPVDGRTDIWSLGVVLYEMLGGKKPFDAPYDQAALFQILHDEPQRLSDLRGDLPRSVIRIVDRCLRKDRAQRYPNAQDLVSELKSAESPESATATHGSGLLKAISSRRGQWLTLSSLGCVLILSLLYAAEIKVPLLFPQVFTDAASMPQEKHLVVLPFKYVGDDPAYAVFADGMTEVLTSKLAQMESPASGSYWVVPASDVSDRGVSTAAQAAQHFGATVAVDGFLQRSEAMVRLTLNLIDAKSVRLLQSAEINVPHGDLLELQDGVAAKLAELLEMDLSTRSQSLMRAGRTTVPDAYDFYVQGRGYLQRFEQVENIEAAIALFQRALREDSLYAHAYAGLGEAFWRLYEVTHQADLIPEAVSHARKASLLDDHLAAAHVTLGLVYRGTGRYPEAVSAFRNALALDPTDADAHRGIARAYADMGDLATSEAEYLKAIELQPNYWAGYNALGAFYASYGQYEKASEQFRHVVTLTPDNPRGYSNLGGMYLRLQRRQEAQAMLERSISISPTYAAVSNLASLYYFDGRFREAAEMYEKALQIQDGDYQLWGYLAMACRWIPERADEAEGLYRQALERAELARQVNPSDPLVLVDLSSYYAALGSEAQARALLEYLTRFSLDDLDVIYTVAETYEILGERGKALEYLESAVKNGLSIDQIEAAPGLQNLRSDSGYREMVRRLG